MGKRRNTYKNYIDEMPSLGYEEKHLISQEIQKKFAYSEFSPGVHYRLNQGLHWKEEDIKKLYYLCSTNSSITKCADILGRNEAAIAKKACQLNLPIPISFWDYIPKKKPQKKEKGAPRDRRSVLNYPFLIKVDPTKNSDLIEVNNLVSKVLDPDMRADICQEILLDVHQGKINIETLKKMPDIIKQYKSRWRKANLENGGYGLMYLQDEEKRCENYAMNEMRETFESFAIRVPATQIEEIYELEREEAIEYYMNTRMYATHDEAYRAFDKRNL